MNVWHKISNSNLEATTGSTDSFSQSTFTSVEHRFPSNNWIVFCFEIVDESESNCFVFSVGYQRSMKSNPVDALLQLSEIVRLNLKIDDHEHWIDAKLRIIYQLRKLVSPLQVLFRTLTYRSGNVQQANHPQTCTRCHYIGKCLR